MSTRTLYDKVMTMENDSVLVVFGEEMPVGDLSRFGSILSGEKLNNFIKPGSVSEASAFAEELSQLRWPDGSRISKSVVHHGYEFWWIHYNSLFTYFCLPYTQYHKLLKYLKDFEHITLYQPPYKRLFSSYLAAYGRQVTILSEPRSILPFGLLLQVILTLISLPIILLQRKPLMVFIGDKFEKGKDYDFRMKFIYQELRERKMPFVEFIRSLEPGKTVLKHFFARKRPAVYSEAIAFMAKFPSLLSKAKSYPVVEETDPERRFRTLLGTLPLLHIDADIRAIRLMKSLMSLGGIEAAYFTAALERNFHAVLGAKLNAIPTVGILHGAPSKYYNAYDFTPGFDGAKMLSVDKYGLWSAWWKEYYTKHSQAYKPEQLYVSGLMRPLENKAENPQPTTNKNGPVKVLFISEQLAAPEEVMPYLTLLLKESEIDLSIKFRPAKDGFEEWLQSHKPELLKEKNLKVLRGGIADAIAECDVAVGSHSTAVLEALLLFKAPILFHTSKWGDCFSMKEHGNNHPFFALNPQELIERIKNVRTISNKDLVNLRERYFGDPYKNGATWVVDQLEEALKGNLTRK